MPSKDEIKILLERFRTDKTTIKVLSKYPIGEILQVAIKNNMNDIIIELFQPIEINGEYKQFYDYYSTIDTGNIEYDDKEYLRKMRDMIDIDNPHTRDMKLKNSLAREVSGWGHAVCGEEDVRYYAEPACLETMLYLYRNNITTTMNDTCCKKGEKEEETCEVWINYETLSDENKEEVNKLIEEGLAKFISGESVKTISIFVPCKEDETIGEVSDRLMKLTRRFKKQISYRGLMKIDYILNILSKTVRDYIYSGEMIPESEERYVDLFIKYIEEGLLKPLELSDYEISERNYELVQTDDGLFSTVEFLKVINELEPKIIDDLVPKIPYYSIYRDEDGRYWESKKYYDNYLEEKKQIETEKTVKS